MSFVCELACLPDDCVRCAEARRLVEGETCALSYNEDGDWFDDEDEEFSFEYSTDWFAKALEDGVAERDEMMNGYLEFKVVDVYTESLGNVENTIVEETESIEEIENDL